VTPPRRLAAGDRLVIASHNAGKVREIEALVAPHGVSVVAAGELGLAEPEETGTTFAANAALNRRRTLGRKNARLRKLEARQAAGDDLPASPRNPESAAFGTQVQAQVQEALLQLPDDLRVATVLYDIEGLSYREIAAALEIPEGTVKSRIHRARSALREGLKGLVSNENKGE